MRYRASGITSSSFTDSLPLGRFVVDGGDAGLNLFTGYELDGGFRSVIGPFPAQPGASVPAFSWDSSAGFAFRTLITDTDAYTFNLTNFRASTFTFDLHTFAVPIGAASPAEQLALASASIPSSVTFRFLNKATQLAAIVFAELSPDHLSVWVTSDALVPSHSFQVAVPGGLGLRVLQSTPDSILIAVRLPDPLDGPEGAESVAVFRWTPETIGGEVPATVFTALPGLLGIIDALFLISGDRYVTFAAERDGEGMSTGDSLWAFSDDDLIPNMVCRLSNYTPDRSSFRSVDLRVNPAAGTAGEAFVGANVIGEDGEIPGGFGGVARIDLATNMISAVTVEHVTGFTEIADLRIQGDGLMVLLDGPSPAALELGGPAAGLPFSVNSFVESKIDSNVGGAILPQTEGLPIALSGEGSFLLSPPDGAGGAAVPECLEAQTSSAPITIKERVLEVEDITSQYQFESMPFALTVPATGDIRDKISAVNPGTVAVEAVEIVLENVCSDDPTLLLPKLDIARVDSVVPLVNVVWTALPDQNYAIERSRDGGKSWETREMITPSGGDVIERQYPVGPTTTLWRIVATKSS